MWASTVFLLIFSGGIAALISAALRNAAERRDLCYRSEPRGTIDHAVHEDSTRLVGTFRVGPPQQGTGPS
jgi:hypothetical protein